MSRLRTRFNRNARRVQPALPLLQEVNDRLLQHMECLKPESRCILDLGAGAGMAAAGLRARFPQAFLLALDCALEALRSQSWRPKPWWRLGPPDVRAALCATAEQLPLATDSVDLVWCNLVLPWCALPQVLSEVRRVLRPEGLFLFSTFGPDTLLELRTAQQQAQTQRPGPLPEWTDMHDIGDALVMAGFANPVMDRENLRVDYPDLERLLEDVRWSGAPLAAPAGCGLGGRSGWRAVRQAYEALRGPQGLPATFELVYGHAWKPAPRVTAAGKPIIPLRSR